MGEQTKALESRICWSASSNISFKGCTDWHEDAPGSTVKEVEDYYYGSGGGAIGEGLSMALEGSGFDWWVETREVGVSDAV
jgi:hypothetical protein